MDEPVIIAIDAVGGDKGSEVMVEGALAALALDPTIALIMVGPAAVVEPLAEQSDRIIARPTTQTIAMDEHPSQAIRKKKDSSIVVGCQLVKDGEAQGFYSPGSTGACLTAATLIIGRVKGVLRPALCTILPSPIKPSVLCDVGANADCKPQYLVQFGQMARAYASIALDIADPKIALLNIGEEPTKGNQLALEAYERMEAQLPGFIGNAEGRDLLDGPADVYVTDGFTGNVCLKTIEGAASVLFQSVKSVMTSSPITKMAALPLMSGFKVLKQEVSPDKYGAAPLLGVKGVCMVGHGSSNSEAVKNAILTTAKCIRMNLEGRIAADIAALKD